MTAVLLPFFLLFCAIVIDVGYWWVNGKKAQIAADSCALAAAHHLKKNYDLNHCLFGSQDYVLINIPQNPTPEVGTVGTRHISTRVVSPYNGDDSLVEATVKMRVRTFFGGLVGLDWIDLTRRAVAEKLSGSGNYAIYSHSPGCPQDTPPGDSLQFNGQNHWINGLVHSNGQFLMNNQAADPPNNEPFWAADGTRVFCGASTNNEDHLPSKFGGDGYDDPDAQNLPRELPGYETWPTWFTPSEFGWPNCSGANFSAEEIIVKSDMVELKKPTFGGPDRNVLFSGTVPGGTYCATKAFKINADNITGTITALAPEITVDGSNQDLSPHAGNGVLFFTVPNKDVLTGNDGSHAAGGNPWCEVGPSPNPKMVLNGNSHTWEGILFNPCGQVAINVGGSSIGSPALAGTILGYEVKVNGENFSMIGTGDFGGTVDLALVE